MEESISKASSILTKVLHIKPSKHTISYWMGTSTLRSSIQNYANTGWCTEYLNLVSTWCHTILYS